MASRAEKIQSLKAQGFTQAEINQYETSQRAQRQRLEEGAAKSGAAAARIEAEPGPSLGGEISNALGAIGSRFNETFGFGLPAKAMDAAGLSSQDERDSFKQASPNAANLGGGIGYGASAFVGPEALIAKGAGAAATAATDAIPALARTAVGRVATGAGTGAAAGALTEAARGSAQGVPLSELPEQALQGAEVGGALGAGGHLIGEGLRGARNLLRSNAHIGGRASAAESGIYNDPEIARLPKGEQGVQDASQRALQKIVNRDQEMGREASAAYHEQVDPSLSKLVDRKRMVSELEARRAFDTLDPDTGIPLNDGVTGAFDKAIDNTGMKPTVAGTLARRRALQESAGFGSASPTDKQVANQKVYQAFRGAVRGAAPEVGAADDAYSAYAGKAQRRNDLLFNTEDNVVVNHGGLPEALPIEHADGLLAGKPQTLADDLEASSEARPRVAKERSASTFLKRTGDENEPGLRAKRYLDELGAQDPEFAKAITELAAKKHLEATRPSLRGLIPTNLEGATSLAGFGPVIKQNSRAIGYGAQALADEGSQLAPALSLNPVVRAYITQKERERQRDQMLAEKLKAGGR